MDNGFPLAGQAMRALTAAPNIRLDNRADGTMILRSNVPLRPGVQKVTQWLEHWAEKTPDTVFVAHRRSADLPWRKVTYRQALQQVEALASSLLERGLGPDRPVVILSDNSIEVLLLSLAAMHVGVPVANITSAYSLIATDYSKLQAMAELVTPGLVYVNDAARFANALASLSSLSFETVVANNVGSGHQMIDDLTRRTDASAIRKANAGIGPDTITRILFTSGSTGVPKAVINTHRMHTTLAEAKTQLWPMLEDEPPVLADWLPWSHTFGANHNLFLVLRNGGSLYIDTGRPLPNQFDTTIANIMDVRPNFYLNIPRGYDMLVHAMEKNGRLRDLFFSSVKVVFYAAAALPQSLWDRLTELSIEATGKPTMIVSAWGSTETSPLATDCHFQAERSGNLGVPIPGVELKLIPSADKLEVRVKGPNITPGYFRNSEATEQAFDEEGYFRIGDAVKLADPADPNKGLLFDGRVKEDFKLSSGTWVNVAQLRLNAISVMNPLVQDIVIAGHEHDYVGFLIFPNIDVCRDMAGLDRNAPVSEVISHSAIRGFIHEKLKRLKDEGKGSSTFARTALLMEAPPSINIGEITDKGYINQRRVLECRAAFVERLMAEEPIADRIDIL